MLGVHSVAFCEEQICWSFLLKISDLMVALGPVFHNDDSSEALI